MDIVRRAGAILILAAAILPAGTGAAQDKPADQALLAAKTIYVANGTGDRYSADPVVRELKGWRRFTLVNARDAADLVLTIGLADVDASLGIPISSAETRAPKTIFTLKVEHRASGQTVWSDNQERGLRAGAAMTRVTKRFREYVEKAALRTPRSD